MSEYNSCAGLVHSEAEREANAEYTSIIESGHDPLDEMLQMQQQLQVDLHNKLPDHNPDPTEIRTKGELIQWIDGNFDAIMDEFRELKTSIGGIDTYGEKDANAVWKRWKADHSRITQEEIDDMSHQDELEMKMELVDLLHFVFNCVIGMGMDSREVFILYYLKNRENFNRYQGGY